MALESKTCTKCHVEQPLDRFYRNPSNACGRQGHCKQCERLIHAAWRKKNAAHFAAYQRAYWRAHRTEFDGYAKKWRRANKEKYDKAIKKSNKEWRKNNPEKLAQYASKWLRANLHRFAAWKAQRRIRKY